MNGRQRARAFIRATLPAPVDAAVSRVLEAVSLEHRRRRAERRRAEDLARAVAPDGRVTDGPFAGAWMSHRSTWGGAAPYLAGRYECELWSELEHLIDRRPTRVVDIGSAEGYYAIGLARRLPGTEVVAFDPDDAARRMCEAAAAANGVADQVSVRPGCDVATLAGALVNGALVVCDCEGAELPLLDPEVLPVLRTCDLLVEVHDFIDPRIHGTLLERFGATHEIVTIWAEERAVPAHLGHLDPADVTEAVDEHRPTEPHPMRWLVMTGSSRVDDEQ